MKLPWNKTEIKEHPHGIAYFMPSGKTFSKQDAKAFAQEGYAENVVVYRAIREIVTALCNIDIVVYKNGEPIEDKYAENALKLLKQPNPVQGKDSFFENVFTDFSISGEMFVYKDKENGLPKELWALNPLEMDVKAGREGIPAAFVHKVGNKEKTFPVGRLDGVSQVFFHKLYNPLDFWRGQSPLQAAAIAGDTHNNGMKWNNKLLKNSARPSGILQFEDESVSNDVLNRAKEYFKDQMTGVKNAGSMPILTGKAKWQSVDMSPRDMDYLNTMKEMAKYVASAYGVPLPLIDNDASTFNNMEQAKERLYTDTVIPMLNKFLNHFSNWLLDDGYDYEIDMDSITALEGLRQRRFDRMINAVNSGVMTRDEARIEIALQEVGGLAQELFIPTGQIPIGLAGFEALPEEDKALAVQMRSLGYSDNDIKAVLNG